MIPEDGRYYVYYTKGEGKTYGFRTEDPSKKVFPWDQTDVYCASSEDGRTWKEEGVAVALGAAGSYDHRAVFTPEVLHHNDKFYLVYQVVKAPYMNRVKNNIGMAISGSITLVAIAFLLRSVMTELWQFYLAVRVNGRKMLLFLPQLSSFTPASTAGQEESTSCRRDRITTSLKTAPVPFP